MSNIAYGPLVYTFQKKKLKGGGGATVKKNVCREKKWLELGAGPSHATLFQFQGRGTHIQTKAKTSTKLENSIEY